MFVKGDIIIPTLGNEYLMNEPILVLSDMIGDCEIDGMCNLCIGKNGRIVKFWHNPEYAKLYDGNKDSDHYRAIMAIKESLFGKE